MKGRKLRIVFPEQEKYLNPAEFTIFRAVSKKYPVLRFKSSYNGPVSEIGIRMIYVQIPEQKMKVSVDEYPAIAEEFGNAGLMCPYFL